MNAIHALALGVVEGLTEFLPVSSTGHLILTARLLGLEQTEFIKSFEIAIQLGAVLAVIAFYWRRFFLDPETLKRVFAAFVPTAVVGLVLYKFIKRFLLSGDTVVLWALAIGGLVLIAFDLAHKEKHEPAHTGSISYSKCVWIGCAQAFSVIPGVSRSAATILGGLALGLPRQSIVEFSFLLAVPTILAAAGFDLWKSGAVFTRADWDVLAIGTGVSFAVALASIRFLLRYVQNHGFFAFGVYRVLAAAAFWYFVR